MSTRAGTVEKPPPYRPNIELGQDLRTLLGIQHCPLIRSAQDVAQCFGNLAGLQKEVLVSAALDSQCKLVHWALLAVGRNDMLVMRVGDAFAGAIAVGASGIVLIHNHPSGSLQPSVEDLDLTRKVAEAGLALDYVLYDHVILSSRGCRSLLNQRDMKRHCKVQPIVSTILCDQVSGRKTSEWRCRRCGKKNPCYHWGPGATSAQGVHASKCSDCGTFAWLQNELPHRRNA